MPIIRSTGSTDRLSVVIDALLAESECLMREGRLDDAEKFIDGYVSSINNARGRLANALGVVYARGGWHERAERLFEMVVKEHPEVTKAKANLRMVRAERQRHAVLRLELPERARELEDAPC